MTAAADEQKMLDLTAVTWATILGMGAGSKSGAPVSTHSAMGVTPFYRGVLVIAEGIAQLPVEIYKRRDDGRGAEPATDHPLYDILLHQPNALQDAAAWLKTTLIHAVATGNGISYRVTVNGELRELLPVRPEGVSIDLRGDYEPIYNLSFENGYSAQVPMSEVFHLRGPSWNGWAGLDPVRLGREAIGLAQATEETHSRFHANGARPSGALVTSQRLTKEQVESLREAWQQSFGGTENTGRTPVLGGGLDWKQVSMSGVDAEHLDTRKHQIEEIARLLGVFPIMLGHAGDQSPTFASADAFLEAHVRYTLQPWMKTVRSAIETQLLTKEERRAGYFCKIDSSELLRGSLKDRAEYYRAALGSNSNPGWLKPNEVREDDGWNPDDDPEMDKVWQPQTMAPVGAKPVDPPQSPTLETKSSTPRTLYVSRKLLNGGEFLRWARAQGFSTTLAAEDLHVTIAYSRAPVDWMEIGEAWCAELTIPAGGPRVVERVGKEGAVALKFTSSELKWRNEAIRERGATWDWPEYQPHVTITYDASGVDLANVEPFQGELRFGPEIFEQIKAP